eukprot:scaffold147052_cov18-Tisochrysis_lutea.AAC.1
MGCTCCLHLQEVQGMAHREISPIDGLVIGNLGVTNHKCGTRAGTWAACVSAWPFRACESARFSKIHACPA